jgi:hypothetical protein
MLLSLLCMRCVFVVSEEQLRLLGYCVRSNAINFLALLGSTVCAVREGAGDVRQVVQLCASPAFSCTVDNDTC